MKVAGFALALVLGLAVFAPADEAKAKTYVSFGFYGPGFYGYGHPYRHHRHYRHGYFGPGYYYGPRHYYGTRYYYGPRYYRPSRYYGPRYYRPYRYRRGGSCGYWARQCGKNWGYGNANFRGCMRYEGC